MNTTKQPARVIAIHPRILLGQIDEVVDHLNVIGLTVGMSKGADADAVLFCVSRLRELTEEMGQALTRSERLELQRQLEASIELMQTRRNGQ